MSSNTSKPPFRRVLVANRGEIAVRIIRACHALGIEAVAVFSDADRGALHVRYADHAVHIGGSEPKASYLDMDKVLEAAKTSGADAVHPGYGFLAENAAFGRACAEAGITFIGPSPEALEAMGDKIQARERMTAAGVPLVPGDEHVTIDNLHAVAEKIGYPLMIKASAGGGGKGIRAVFEEKDLVSSFERAQGEAGTAFGNAACFVERLVQKPHHIEIQILGDAKGNVVHLFERECSVQRRHQKVVEEAPSAFMTPELREAMGQAAIDAAKAVDYVGAGTVEFLVDGNREFYFLEMNTRLQVEHPITEAITGVDIVEEMIRVAAGEPLSFSQEDLAIDGHAIEVRVCAEDPDNGFLPSIGTVDALAVPGGPGVRLDSALFPGLEVTLFYDSLLGKLIAWGPDRDAAIRRLRQALSEFKIADLKTNVAYLSRILRNEEFLSGTYDTGILERMEAPSPEPTVVEAAAIAAALAAHERSSRGTTAAQSTGSGMDPWRLEGRRRQMRSRS